MTSPPDLAQHLIALALKQIGVREDPPHSNRGTLVESYQRQTGTVGQPWCVSFRQWLDVQVFGSPYALNTANAYAYEAYAIAHGDTRVVPMPGDAVVYHLGAGHMGTVLALGERGKFSAVEGNEGDAVLSVGRDRSLVRCTFIRRTELHRHE